MQSMQVCITVPEIGQPRCPHEDKSLCIMAIEAELIFVFGKSDIQLVGITSLEQERKIGPVRVVTAPAFSRSNRPVKVTVHLQPVTELRVTAKAE